MPPEPGQSFAPSLATQTRAWRISRSLGLFRYLHHHRVHQRVVTLDMPVLALNDPKPPRSDLLSTLGCRSRHVRLTKQHEVLSHLANHRCRGSGLQSDRIAPAIAASIISMANLSGGSFRSGAVRSIASIAFRDRCPVRLTNAGPPTSGATLYRATEMSARCIFTSTNASTTSLIISDIGL